VVESPLLVSALYASVAVGVAAAILAWRQRPDPGATPLVWLLGGQTWWSVCTLFRVSSGATGAELFWTRVGWVGVVVVPVAWVSFALEYTGRDQYLTRRYVALLSTVPVVTVLLAFTPEYHDLLVIRQTTPGPGGRAVIDQGGVWFVLIAAYTYVLGVVGVVPILGMLWSTASTFRGQSTTLLLGAFTPLVTSILFNLGAFGDPTVDPTPIAFAVSGVAYLGAISRFELFGKSPAPNWRARQFLFDNIQEGAVVVDRHDVVVEMNEACAEILDTTLEETLGEPAADVLPSYESFPAADEESTNLTVGDETASQSYDVTVTEITDRQQNLLGKSYTLHDITQYLQQQQRLKVLNRALRHNIRTETNIIHGYADRTDATAAEIIKRRAMRIVEVGEKGRDAIELFDAATEEPQPESLSYLLEGAIQRSRETYPDVQFSLTGPDTDVPVPSVASAVLRNVIENAAEHNTGDSERVDVSATVDGDAVTVHVVDDGPGIEAYELDVLESGTETALQHGSGLGLWVVKWGVEVIGGSVRFESREPTGTRVILTIPTLGPESGEAVAESRLEVPPDVAD
jgi:signal transduction histidine kinase